MWSCIYFGESSGSGYETSGQRFSLDLLWFRSTAQSSSTICWHWWFAPFTQLLDGLPNHIASNMLQVLRSNCANDVFATLGNIALCCNELALQASQHHPDAPERGKNDQRKLTSDSDAGSSPMPRTDGRLSSICVSPSPSHPPDLAPVGGTNGGKKMQTRNHQVRDTAALLVKSCRNALPLENLGRMAHFWTLFCGKKTPERQRTAALLPLSEEHRVRGTAAL